MRVAALYDIHGNLPALDAVLAELDSIGPDGARSEDGVLWLARRLARSHRDFVARFAPLVRIDIPGLGPTLFCHGSPRSDDEDITDRTPERRPRAILTGVEERVLVCGHSHRQFDRRVLGRRVLNAGSVGMPYEGVAGAFWLLLGPTVEHRHDLSANLHRERRRLRGRE